MKIVVLDGYTLNPGDLSWGSLHALGEVSIYEWTPKNEIANRCKSADIVLTNKTILDATIINNLDTVKYIGVLATGYNVVDVKSASKRGIVVTNVPNYGPSSVAQHTFALILELVNQVGVHNQSVKEGEWAKTEDFCYNLTPLVSLEGKVIGIVGYGYIGKRVARIAQGFGMEVLIHSKSAKSTDIGQLVSIERLNRESDIISLHCALTEDNENMINKSFLSKMKSRSYLINTSRGPLINEADLVKALDNDDIAGAGLDVLSIEPPKSRNPLMEAKNCIITPHIAWATKEARQNLLNIAVGNIQAFKIGQPTNVI